MIGSRLFKYPKSGVIRYQYVSCCAHHCGPHRQDTQHFSGRSAKMQSDNRLIGHSVDIEYTALSVTSESSPPPVPQLIYRRWKAQVLSSENFRWASLVGIIDRWTSDRAQIAWLIAWLTDDWHASISRLARDAGHLFGLHMAYAGFCELEPWKEFGAGGIYVPFHK
jgi:hypothetical protein